MNEHQLAPTTRYDSSQASSGLHTSDSDSAGLTHFSSQGPSMLEPSSCLVQVTHAASGIQTNANTMAPQVPPALRPTFFGNYSSEAGLSQPYFRWEVTNLFGLPKPRPSRLGEPAGTMPTTTAIDYQTPEFHQQALGNATLSDGVYGLAAPRPTVISELQEMPRGATTATRQPPSMTEALQVVPDTDLDNGPTVLHSGRQSLLWLPHNSSVLATRLWLGRMQY